MSQPNVVIIVDDKNADTGEYFLNLDGVWSPIGTALPTFDGYNVVRMPKTTYDLHIAAVLAKLSNLKTFLGS